MEGEVVDVSVCIATYKRDPKVLEQVLESICRQTSPLKYEVIICDHGNPADDTRKVCDKFPVMYHRIERGPGDLNPCVPRNVTYRAAAGRVLILQSDDVVHVAPDTIGQLFHQATIRPRSFVIARVLACGPDGEPWSVYTGAERKKPYFFLGAVHRKHLYQVGGNDEDFAEVAGYEDRWFADCLTRGAGLSPVYSDTIVGHHLYHPRRDTDEQATEAEALYAKKYNRALATATWQSRGGPWAEEKGRVFDEAFDLNTWGDGESRSGPGSSLAATRVIRQSLPSLLGLLHIETMLDIPCGDHNWMNSVDLGITEYTGADISRSVIQANQDKYGTYGPRFEVLDIRNHGLPRCDLVLCRDCLVHLSLADCRSVIANIRRSKSKYLLTTTFWNHDNRDIQTGPDWVPRSLRKAPFHFPPPMIVINEECTEHSDYTDKSLALWRVSEL